MDGNSGFFSPEALRLLEGSSIEHETTLQENELPVHRVHSTVLKQYEAPTELGSSQSLKRIPRGSTLSLSQIGKPKRNRARFKVEARRKVATVREKGACLRCRVLKIPVSTSASDLKVSHERILVLRVLAMHFMYP